MTRETISFSDYSINESVSHSNSSFTELKTTSSHQLLLIGDILSGNLQLIHVLLVQFLSNASVSVNLIGTAFNIK